MKLLSIELVNFCQHKHLVVNFHSNLNVIIGPIGIGKSNLIKAIYAGFTGDFSRFVGIKTDNITQNSNSNEKSYIKISCEINGNLAEITRSIRPSGRKLVLNGVTFTKEIEINKIIDNWFTIPIRDIAEYMFVDQKYMDSFIDQQAADRQANLRKLFRINKTEQCFNLLNKRISNIETTDYQPIILEYIEKVNNFNNQLNLLNNDLSSLIFQSDNEYSSNLNFIKKQLNIFNKYNLIKDSVLVSKNKELISINNQTETLKKETFQMSNEKENVDINEINTLKQFANDIKDNEKIEEELKDINSQIAEIENQKRALVKPLLIGKWTEANDNELLELEVKYHELKKFIDTFDPFNGEASCPICGTASENLKETYDHSKKEYDEVAALVMHKRQLKIKALKNQEDITKFNILDSKYSTQLSILNSRKSSLEVNLKPTPSMSKETILSKLERLMKSIKKNNELDQNLFRKYETLKSLNARFNLLKEEVKSIEEELVELKLEQQLDLGTHTEFETQIHELENQYQMYRDLVAKIAFYKEQIEAVSLDISNLNKKNNKMKLIQNFQNEMITLREIFHRDALPRLVSQQYLNAITSDVNTYLNELQADFIIQSTSDLSFQVIFPDGRNIPLERLSGGERVIFSLAWRLAINSNFASDLGIICLDEPTYGLNPEKMECVYKALSSLRFLSGSKGVQCIIITHEMSLLPLFDNIIKLGE